VQKQGHTSIQRLYVAAGELRCGDTAFRCAVGRGGVRTDKTEGDGATPVGCFALPLLLYRPDRVAPIPTALPVRPLRPQDGWCDDPAHAQYNQLIEQPFAASHESLWREDALYDVIIVIAYNMSPVVPGKGSAIFLHSARPDFTPTDGCIALTRTDLLAVAAACTLNCKIEIAP
jgi:L,D-peptidoglycan transpeptidase YkuD (ErfK/YbiS/YcfS/YnhG family)